MKYWFVNLGKFYTRQRTEEFLWAPLKNKAGNKVSYWENMNLIEKGDIIFCNKSGFLRSVGIAKGIAYPFPKPKGFDQSWDKNGRRVDIEFIDFAKPFRFSDYKETYLDKINKEENPFDRNGDAKQAYLNPFDKSIVKMFMEKINDKELNSKISTITNNLLEEQEELEEEREQLKIINSGLVPSYSEEELQKLEGKSYNYTSPKSGKTKNKREKTDPRLKATRLEKANYLCEVNSKHSTFLNSKGNNQYMECHHIIPMKAQIDFKYLKLDNLFNLISLCPVCHAQIHYANNKDKAKIFNKIYGARKEQMLNLGFDLAKINEIFVKYYKGNNQNKNKEVGEKTKWQ
jgi:Predicted restriction endonuclease